MEMLCGNHIQSRLVTKWNGKRNLYQKIFQVIFFAICFYSTYLCWCLSTGTFTHNQYQTWKISKPNLMEQIKELNFYKALHSLNEFLINRHLIMISFCLNLLQKSDCFVSISMVMLHCYQSTQGFMTEYNHFNFWVCNCDVLPLH